MPINQAVRASRGVGRPRRLTLQEIVETGGELGLARLSVSAVALRLGVTPKAVYSHVANQDELYRLVSAAMAKSPSQQDVGQHWTDIARAAAKSQFDILSAEPDLLIQIIGGALSPAAALGDVENFLELLTVRGFSSDEAFDLHCQISQLAAGAAVSVVIRESWRRRGEPREATLAHAFAMPEGNQYPLLRSLGRKFIFDHAMTDYGPALERILVQFERTET